MGVIKKIVFILIVLIPAGCSTNKDIVFEEENDLYFFLLDKAKQKRIHIIQEDIPNYFEGFTISNSEDSISLKQLRLNDRYKIDLFTYTYIPSDYSRFHSEYIQINNY